MLKSYYLHLEWSQWTKLLFSFVGFCLRKWTRRHFVICYWPYQGIHNWEPISPIQALGVNSFPSRFIIRTVPRVGHREKWSDIYAYQWAIELDLSGINVPRKRHNNYRENGRFWRSRVRTKSVISVVKKMSSLTLYSGIFFKLKD